MPGIAAVIHSSNLPMYFIDNDRTVIDCNKELGDLVDLPVAEIIGKNLRSLTLRFSIRVLESRRKRFLADNLELAKKTACPDVSPHVDAFEYVDNRGLTGRYRGLHRVWFHADKVSAKIGGTIIGSFVVYQVETLPDGVQIPDASPTDTQ
jgi:hypothetical protein